jgi:cysteine desulfurase
MPAIAGFAAAVGAFGSTQENLKKVTALRDELLALVSKIPGVQIHSPADALPYIVNLSLAEIPSQVSVNFLSMHGVYVSAGSACSKGHRSPVLQAMALDPKQIDSAVRISLSHETTKEEIEYCAQMLNEAVVQLRKKG